MASRQVFFENIEFAPTDEILWCVSVSYGVTLTTKICGVRCFRFSFLIYFLILLGDDPKRAENLRTKFG